LGLLGFALPGIEVGSAVSAILLGVMVGWEARPPRWVAAAVVGFFANFHGPAPGAELPAGADALLYSIGFVVATGTLHAVGIGIGEVRRVSFGRGLLRAAGALVAAGGVFFLWRALA
jgi:urease accessory protein